jgi:hypothetical protein
MLVQPPTMLLPRLAVELTFDLPQFLLEITVAAPT